MKITEVRPWRARMKPEQSRGPMITDTVPATPDNAGTVTPESCSRMLSCATAPALPVAGRDQGGVSQEAGAHDGSCSFGLVHCRDTERFQDQVNSLDC
jgi:hypothetical protein